jgi:hydrogenase maturation protein HypF
VDDLRQLYDTTPEAVACDLHPDYLSTRYAKELPIPVYTVQHHYAHIASCMAENELEGRVLGVSWDGTGYGLDGTIWGGEFLLTTPNSFRRIGTIRPFKLPGGASAIKEPRRSAVGALYEIFGDSLFDRTDLIPLRSFGRHELAVIQRMLSKGINAPTASSVGRLFDAVASIVGLRQRVTFEGQAAMELEFALPSEYSGESYEFSILANHTRTEISSRPRVPFPERASEVKPGRSFEFTGSGESATPLDTPQSEIQIDWFPIMLGILDDVQRGVGLGVVSTKFHNSLTEIIVRVAEEVGEQRLVLSGGCFQNRYLTETTIRRLRAAGFRPYWHQRVPPNDGGIALGQINAVMREQRMAPNETHQGRRQFEISELPINSGRRR